MENNKEDLKDFDKLVEKFDEFTDKYSYISLNAISNRYTFDFIIKNKVFDELGLLKKFVKLYFINCVVVDIEILNKECLSIRIVGFN